MGDPRKSKKTYARPNRPWDKDRIEKEKEFLKAYGLRRKKEIWKAQTILSDYRRRARELIATYDEEKTNILINKLVLLGLLDKKATLDDVLDLTVEQLLERRLQTMTVKAELANTHKQARQFIVHGHIKIKNQKITTPSYIVKIDEEKDISYMPNTGLAKTLVLSKKKMEKKEAAAQKEKDKEKDKPEAQKDAVEELKEAVEKTTKIDAAIESIPIK